MSIRQAKGRQIAERFHIARQGRLWLVPSQSGKGKYKVDAEKRQCTCPDFEKRAETVEGFACKHILAVRCWKLQQDGQAKQARASRPSRYDAIFPADQD